ncbi:hypothetical protein [Sphingorhabdus sp. SMR4y]|uniref:hypothetical protein n=1 Tax=Sphingorhabdus sp. SMR4y TaxID=2584094 RepID=UPI0021B45080|nr:hypothetical protein [Sphingorhabdus sp. SMR4y]
MAENMPNMLAHEGRWDGIYRHQDSEGNVLDQHRTLTRCEFPDSGKYAYIQHNDLIWADGRTESFKFGGIYKRGRIYWETDRFAGYGWESDGLILLRLDRKDAPGERYTEMIEISGDGHSRARTWQWFRDDTPYRRTLCDEKRIT